MIVLGNVAYYNIHILFLFITEEMIRLMAILNTKLTREAHAHADDLD